MKEIFEQQTLSFRCQRNLRTFPSHGCKLFMKSMPLKAGRGRVTDALFRIKWAREFIAPNVWFYYSAPHGNNQNRRNCKNISWNGNEDFASWVNWKWRNKAKGTGRCALECKGIHLNMTWETNRVTEFNMIKIVHRQLVI